MSVGIGKAEYVQTDIKRECQKCKYSLKAGFLCREKLMQENEKVPTDKETGFKIVHPTMGCCDEWDPGEGVNLLQAPPPATLSEKFIALSRKHAQK